MAKVRHPRVGVSSMLALVGPGFVGGMVVGRCARKVTLTLSTRFGEDDRAAGVPSEHHRD
ncbi:hypothetical protein [Rudaea cellulosilytica]|uniref:hypothetical protein n=1 Tax=Rudaea cellulosilytica TaxID=540746 RepID=UPI0003A31AF2|nr:hypothetical protein [Rudaea cellulosilytica]